MEPGQAASPVTIPIWFRLLALLVVQIILLGVLLAVATTDPHGLTEAPSIRASDVPNLEPLYGAVWTPDETLDWSPDGRYIALAGDIVGGVAILDAHTGETVGAWPVPGFIYVVRWSPDGTRLAVGNDLSGLAGSPGWVYIYTSQGAPVASWQAHSRSVGGLDWSPNGTQLVTTANTRYAIWDVASENRLWLDTNASTWGDSVDWSPDSRWIAFGANAGPAVYDATTHALVSVFPSSASDERGVAWSHSGSRIASANLGGCTNVLTWDGRVVWDVRESVWNASVPPQGCDILRATRPSWDPTDAMLAVATPAGIRVFDAARGTLLRTLEFPIANYAPSTVTGNYGQGESRDIEAAWSPGGESIASVGSMSHPSFRLWGIRHSSVAAWAAVFNLGLVIGIPVAIGPGFPRLIRKPGIALAYLTRPSSRFELGAFLLGFCFLAASIQQTVLEASGRIYGGWVNPPPSWFATNTLLSIAFAIPAVAVSVTVFRAAVWPKARRGAGTMAMAARTLGFALVPVIWALSLSFLAISLLLIPGLGVPSDLAAGIVAVGGGLGLLVAARIVQAASGGSFRRSVGGLLVMTAVSIGAAFAVFLAFAAFLILFRFPLSGDLATYGIRINFGFGLVPWVAGVVLLAVVGIGAVVIESPPAVLAPLYSRLKASEVLALQSRRLLIEYIERHPGAHFRELLRSLPLGSGNLYYHLLVLEREGWLIARRDGLYRRFFLSPMKGRPVLSGGTP